MKKITIVLLIGFLNANEVSDLPSYQGFRGIINTPNAEVLKEGDFEFLYTNQVDDLYPNQSPDFRDNKEQDNYFLNMGILPNLDLSLRYGYGRNLDIKSAYMSDRILSLKYQLPFIDKDIATVSVGTQDIGGASSFLSSKYIVTSKTFNSFRTSLGYAKGSESGSLDGFFGGVEYEPFSWLQFATEYDTRDWNMAIKTSYDTSIGKQPIVIGAMVKSSLDYHDTYYSFFTTFPFYNKSAKLVKSPKKLPLSKLSQLKELGLSNLSYVIKDDTIYLSYENSVYDWNDIDALGMVLGIVSTSSVASNIEVTVKKSNIPYFTVKTEAKEYQAFLKTGNYKPNLLTFSTPNSIIDSKVYNSDRFKPVLAFYPGFTLIDGSEYGNMDYSISAKAELSMRIAKGTILSARADIPISETDNFKKGGIFDYRNRELGDKVEIDQVLLSQYLKTDIYSNPWINLFQIGEFEKDLKGFSFESAIMSNNGKHRLMAKFANLKDDIYKEIDWYYDTDKREERLLSYSYYWDKIDSNLKVTGGEFLYGDKGVDFSLKRFFSDIELELDISRTDHPIRGTANVGRITLSIPFGPSKRLKTPFVDIKGGDLVYKRRKTLAIGDDTDNYARPFNMEEVSNSFTVEEYYLDKDRFFPSYIQINYMRLRNIFFN